MNYIDTSFYQLTNYLKKLSNQEILENIKYNFLHIPVEIQNSLEDYFKKFNYWGTLNKKARNYEELELRAASIHNHLDDFIWLYEKLEDYRSKKLLYAILNNWYRYDFSLLKECYENNYPDYFDLDIVKCNEEEVVVDLGAYIGDSILDYLKVYQEKYKKIYCYEITEESFQTLKQNLAKFPNIEFRKKGALDKKGMMSISHNQEELSANKVIENGTKEIEVVTIDEDIKQKVTLIKMDIEGAEEQALKGCQKHIQNEQPKLLLSVYHNHEDIWKIPKMIENMQKGYKFYLRYHGGNIFPTEVTLIAIYKNNE